jgi:nucleotide-binding universal stress UspA family protein
LKYEKVAKILVAVDGSDFATKAAQFAMILAKNNNAELLAVNVIDISSIFKMLPSETKRQLIRIGKQDAGRMFDTIKTMANKLDIRVKTETIESHISTADALISYARDKKIDIIVVGTRGRSGIKKALLGSVASKIVTFSPCSVLVVR